MTPEYSRTVLVIFGMRDGSCRDRIAHALERIESVRDADVSLYRARATVTHLPGCEPAELVGAVVQVGYGAALDPEDDRADALAR